MRHVVVSQLDRRDYHLQETMKTIVAVGTVGTAVIVGSSEAEEDEPARTR